MNNMRFLCSTLYNDCQMKITGDGFISLLQLQGCVSSDDHVLEKVQ
jgi:hypothetical protein